MTNKPTITADELATLERMCDDFTLYEVLNALARICHEKAEHIDQRLQGTEGLSERWRKRGLQVQGTAEYLERMEFDRDHTQLHREFTGRLKR